MTREDIIRMAMEADFIPIAVLNHAESLHRFADLVLADNSSAVWQQGCDAGRRSERESCAQLCEDEICNCCWDEQAGAVAEHLAATIRARGNT